LTKGVKLMIVLAAVLFTGALIYALIALRTSDKTLVEIVRSNKVLYTFDLSEEEDRTFRIEYPDGGWNDIRIENGQICISDADCPDHTCIKTGYLRSESIPIVCLPHRLVIRFKDKESD